MAGALRSNSAYGAVEQIVVGAGYFLFYGILIRGVGAELLGVVTLLLVLASIGSMAGAGFGSALAHFLPAFESAGDRAGTISCVDTTLIATAVLYAVTLAAAYVPFANMIAAQAGASYHELVRLLMVPATLHVLLTGIGSALSLALTALRRNDLRLWSTSAGTVAGLTVLIVFLPVLGVTAGLWGLVAQSGTIAVLCWIQLTRVLPGLGPIPRRFDRDMARKQVGLGTNMQVQTLLLAALEPITRLLIGHYGSLSAVALFSMASRFVIQMRAIIYAGAQPLLSAFSHARSEGADSFAKLYHRARQLVAFLAILSTSAVIGAAPFVAEVWVGSTDRSFALYTAVLAIGWMVNTLSLTAYFNAYALGRMWRSLAGHTLLFALNALLGAFLARHFGSLGAVCGIALALVISGIFLAISNGAYAPPMQARGVMRTAILALGGAAAALAAAASYAVVREQLPPLLAGIACGGIWAAIVIPSAAFHPVTQTMVSELALRWARPN